MSLVNRFPSSSNAKPTGPRSPVATEVCDGADVDEDCDGAADDADDADPSTMSTYWLDADGDGYGSDAAPSVSGCDLPAGYAAVAGDCDDVDAAINPAATEVCDGRPSDVEKRVITSDRYCPWSAKVVAIAPAQSH